MDKPSERAIGIAARVWCDWDMRDIVMDIESATKIAHIIDDVLRCQKSREADAVAQEKDLA